MQNGGGCDIALNLHIEDREILISGVLIVAIADNKVEVLLRGIQGIPKERGYKVNAFENKPAGLIIDCASCDSILQTDASPGKLVVAGLVEIIGTDEFPLVKEPPRVKGVLVIGVSLRHFREIRVMGVRAAELGFGVRDVAGLGCAVVHSPQSRLDHIDSFAVFRMRGVDCAEL